MIWNDLNVDRVYCRLTIKCIRIEDGLLLVFNLNHIGQISLKSKSFLVLFNFFTHLIWGKTVKWMRHTLLVSIWWLLREYIELVLKLLRNRIGSFYYRVACLTLTSVSSWKHLSWLVEVLLKALWALNCISPIIIDYVKYITSGLIRENLKFFAPEYFLLIQIWLRSEIE